MEKISVIIPIYKTEKYLDRCISSVVHQTYQNLEIILVDDGSPDRCPEICDEWAKKDDRVRVIHKKNGGAGESRNLAMDQATGEYISLIDSDDYIEPNMYEHLIGLMADDTDIAECELKETEDDYAVLDNGSIYEAKEYSAEEAMRLHILDKLFRQTPPNKLYRRETVGDIRFPVGNQIDDEFWTYRVIAKARKLVHSSCMMYAYRQQPESVMHRSFAISRLQAVDAKSQRLELIKTQFPSLVSTAKINLWQTCVYFGQMSLIHLDKDSGKKAFRFLKENMKNYKPTPTDMKNLNYTQKFWMNLSSMNFRLTCHIRNILQIGL